MDDLARIMREEIADLAARGCTYLQMDEVPLAVICDPNNMEVVRQRGDDPDRLIDLYIDAINDSIRDRPAGMTVCVHMCRGNAGHGMADGGYEPIAERMFNRLEVDGFFLEYDTPRAGDFSPLRYLSQAEKGGAGAHDDQERRGRIGGVLEAPNRRGGEVRRSRPALPLAAMRLRQRAEPRAADHDDGSGRKQIGACRRDGARGVGVGSCGAAPIAY